MASDQQNTSRKSFTFADAVHAVERTFSTATSRPRRSSEAEARRSPSYVLGGGEGSASGSASNDSFPQIDDVQLYALFPSLPQTQPGKGKEGQGEEARRCVRATLEEMECERSSSARLPGEVLSLSLHADPLIYPTLLPV